VRVAGEYFGIQLFPVLAGLGVVLGHMFPVWLGFKGGKGVATFIGVLFAFGRPPIVAVLTCLTWLTMAWATRYSSVAALAAAILAPLYFLLLGTTLFALLAAVLAIFIIFAHRANILRLLRGDEPKIGRA
jgi:glycerol-3-phosphate acyltransferase PlsY